MPAMYSMSKNKLTILFSNLPYKMDNYFLDIQYTQISRHRIVPSIEL
mgnify:CR=1 FL=1